MENNISIYTNSVFEQPWWLDAVAPNSWEEILVEEEGEVVARWPIVQRGNRIGLPKLTQTLGFWLSEKVLTSDPFYNKRKRIINKLLEQLPNNRNIKTRLDHNADYFLPFRWKHFVIDPCISYRIIDLSDMDSIYNGFNTIVKKNIKSASNKVIVQSSDDIEILLTLLDKTFGIQNRRNPWPKDLIRNTYSVSKDHNSSKLLYAIDQSGNIHSGVLFVYDNKVCYYLIAGTDPKYRSSGANTLLIWEGIKFASKVAKSFDFEGSMIEGIENFNRQFGGTPVVYYEIRRQNIFLEFAELLKPKIKSIIGYK
jgi:hypothetical protein